MHAEGDHYRPGRIGNALADMGALRASSVALEELQGGMGRPLVNGDGSLYSEPEVIALTLLTSRVVII